MLKKNTAVFCWAFIAALLLLSLQAYCGNVDKQSTGFTENKGQVIDQDNKPNGEVKFILPSTGCNIELKNKGYSYDFYETNEEGIIRFARVDVEFAGADLSYNVITEHPGDDYENYYTTATPVQGIRNVRKFEKVIYTNIYPNIDVEFISTGEGTLPFKYNFIVRPGGNINDIALAYKGCTTSAASDGSLAITMPMGDFTENIPSSFILESGKKMNVRFIKKDEGTYGFEVDGNTGESTLVIDPKPELIWGTFYGGTGTETASDIAITGNYLFLFFSTTSAASIASSGAYQTTFSDSQSNNYEDNAIVKFDLTGHRKWGTYYGGSQRDYARSMGVSAAGNIYVTGDTKSTTNIASPGAYLDTCPDCLLSSGETYLARFDSMGYRVWGTYYGGAGIEYGTSLVLDEFENIYIGGESGSTGMATPGAHQLTPNTDGDALLSKFDSTGNRIWCTYFGGNDRDAIQDMEMDKDNNLVVTGFSRSSGSVLSTPGVFQPQCYSCNGYLNDGFVAKFDTSGNLAWSSYFGGETTDYMNAVTTDSSGNIYVGGYTQSTENISTPGSFKETGGGTTSDAYLMKISPDGTQLYWGTYIGGSKSDNLYDLVTDKNQNVYVGGNSQSFNNIATPGALQEIRMMTDIYGYGPFINCFSPDGGRIWGTYQGSHSGGSVQEMIFDEDCYLYVTGNIGGPYDTIFSMIKPGSYDVTFSGTSDLFISKLNPFVIEIDTLLQSGCYNDCDGVIDVRINWESTDYTYAWSTGSSIDSIYALCAGPYILTVTDDQNGCVRTFSRTLNTFPAVAVPVITQNGATLTSSIITGINWYATGSPTSLATTASYTPQANGNYYVIHSDNNGCSVSSDTISMLTVAVREENERGLRIYPNPTASVLTIETLTGKGFYQLQDIRGKLLMSATITAVKFNLDISTLSKGIYVLSVFDGEKQVNKKIIKE